MTPGQAPVDPLVIREPHPPAELPLWVIPHHQISVVRRGGLKLGYRHDGHWQEGRLRAGDIVIERAKALLVETNRPLAAVAVSCGFSSQSHMTVAFRRFVGTTPGRWRRIAGA